MLPTRAQKKREELEGGPVTCRCNLGHYDFYASAAGKGNAVAYLQQRWGASWQESAALFDDDNDLSMAKNCRTCLIPTVTAESVRACCALCLRA